MIRLLSHVIKNRLKPFSKPKKVTIIDRSIIFDNATAKQFKEAIDNTLNVLSNLETANIDKNKLMRMLLEKEIKTKMNDLKEEKKNELKSAVTCFVNRLEQYKNTIKNLGNDESEIKKEKLYLYGDYDFRKAYDTLVEILGDSTNKFLEDFLNKFSNKIKLLH